MAEQKPRTTVLMDEALRARLDAYAAETNRTFSGALRQLLTESLDAHDQRSASKIN